MRDALEICNETLQNFREIQEVIFKQLNSRIESQKKKRKKKESRNPIDDLVRIVDLQETILEQKVEFHFSFLREIRKTFREFQKEDSGFLEIENLELFSREISKNISKFKEDIFEEFIDRNVRFVSFSDVIKRLSVNLIDEGHQFSTFLEQIYQSKN